jgi:hypothetical protein
MGQFVPPPPKEPDYDHPLCKATMVCMRGPCQNYWTMITRLDSPGTRISPKHSQACLDDPEMDLNEQNVYACSHWWPEPLRWIPQSTRSLIRPTLVRVYESCLVAFGYDMSWKKWKDDTFEIGKDPKIRGNLKLGEFEK